MCEMCGGQPGFLGQLGKLVWLRCINCGWEWPTGTASVVLDNGEDEL